MPIKTTLNYSPNFNSKKRYFKQIKFIVFHYTGMKKESEAINRLTNIQSEVSCHYLVKKSGEIITIVPESYTAWHAGESSWGSYRSLNKNSIGIELTNPGHELKYKKFTRKQIGSLLKLSKFLIKKYKIKLKNILSLAFSTKRSKAMRLTANRLSVNRFGSSLKAHQGCFSHKKTPYLDIKYAPVYKSR